MGLKREGVVDTFREGKFEWLALTETKLKEDGRMSWCGKDGIIVSVQKIERAREGKHMREQVK